MFKFSTLIYRLSSSSSEFDLQRKFLLFFILHLLNHHLLLLLLYLAQRLFSLQSLLVLPLQQPSPGSVDLSRYPSLNLSPWHSLHSKYLQCNTISSMYGIRNSFNIFIVLTLSMLCHRINRAKLFRTLGTTKMFSLLMMMKNNLIFEIFLTIETKWSQTRHISLLPTHLL